mgnify:FL=1
MNIELTGALGAIATFCFVLTGAMTIIFGTLYILNYFVWEMLIKNVLIYIGAYPSFYKWIFNRKKFDKWYTDRVVESVTVETDGHTYSIEKAKQMLTTDFQFVPILYLIDVYEHCWWCSKYSCDKSIRVALYDDRADIIFGYPKFDEYVNIGSAKNLYELSIAIDLLIKINYK